jgi:hypothetical protein
MRSVRDLTTPPYSRAAISPAMPTSAAAPASRDTAPLEELVPVGFAPAPAESVPVALVVVVDVPFCAPAAVVAFPAAVVAFPAAVVGAVPCAVVVNVLVKLVPVVVSVNVESDGAAVVLSVAFADVVVRAVVELACAVVEGVKSLVVEGATSPVVPVAAEVVLESTPQSARACRRTNAATYVGDSDVAFFPRANAEPKAMQSAREVKARMV